ncbi:MAG: hypothetical protein KAR20_16010 [Candidatus Heimdallarchaeota archaeon]|nr:hypothetical protein [Candidatus Heimdallarchaeota archaeon]
MPLTEKQLAALIEKLDTVDKLTEKIDTLTKQVEDLKPEEETVEKTDARDTSIEKGSVYLRKNLEKVLSKEKLDTMNFDELLVAAEMRDTIKPPTFNPAPPISPKTDTEKRPGFLIPTVD